MERTGFCSGWEFSRNGGDYVAVVVPHDAMLGAKRDSSAPAGSASGYYHGGSYRYRKHFQLTEGQARKHLALEFEGVYRDALVRVNGERVDVPPYGFVPFFADITGLVHPGDNVVEVFADNSAQPDCRWYSGAGLYRPVWLWEGGDERIEPEGVHVTTLSVNPAVIRIDVAHTKGDALTLAIHILDVDDNEVATASENHAEIVIPDALLWSAEQPDLYRCAVELKRGEAVVDRHVVQFGVRMLAWNRSGFFVNGKETLLRGGCIHCDNGILGAASFPESERRRIRLLKDAGFNAIRIAHNPAPAALLDACDELGMYVMDEAWDTWYTPKSAYDYSRHFLDWCDHDLKRLVAHDFNHPSVIMYSIGNEVADPISPTGVALERSLVELLHALDPTRPVTCGLNLAMMVMERAGQGWYGDKSGVAEPATKSGAPRGSLMFNMLAQASGTGMTMLANVPGADALVSPALDALDIAGYNYATVRYKADARKHPGRIVVGSETFPHKLPQNWDLVKRLPNVIGDFMWAAWDYLGEAGAGAWTYTAEEAGFSKPWPWLLSGTGALDIFGNASAHAALAGAVWGTSKTPSIQVRPVNRMKCRTYKATWRGSDAIPSWSWRGCKNETARVEVYDGRAHAIRLELNGQPVGETRVRDFKASFPVVYQPGTLTAIALDEDGHEIARSSLVSAQGALRLEVHPERSVCTAGGIAYVPVSIVGMNGQVESNADELLSASVKDGELLAFGSAQPAPVESFLAGSYTTHYGRAMAVVYRETPGIATLTVCGETLKVTTTQIEFK